MTLDKAIEQMKVVYDYMGSITNVNGKDVHPPSILAAMMQAKARLESAEKVVEAARVLASKAERKKGTTAQWIVWNSELMPLDEALAQHESKEAE